VGLSSLPPLAIKMHWNSLEKTAFHLLTVIGIILFPSHPDWLWGPTNSLPVARLSSHNYVAHSLWYFALLNITQLLYILWLQTGWPGFDCQQKQSIFPIASVFRPALRPTQPPIQWVPGGPLPGVKRIRGVMLTTHPHLVLRSRMHMKLYITKCHWCCNVASTVQDW
jgi:hypothetical protein